MYASSKDLAIVEESIKALIRYGRIKVEYELAEDGTPTFYILLSGVPIELRVNERSKDEECKELEE